MTGVFALTKTKSITSPVGFGTPAVHAEAITRAVGIIVKTGTKMDTLLADNFTLVSENCDPNDTSTSTPPQQCTHVYYQEEIVNVFYAVARQTNNRPFRLAIGNFPFSGSVDYVNKSTDREVEDLLRNIMNQAGNNTFDIIYEP